MTVAKAAKQTIHRAALRKIMDVVARVIGPKLTVGLNTVHRVGSEGCITEFRFFENIHFQTITEV